VLWTYKTHKTYFFSSNTGSRIIVTFVPTGGMRSVQASKARSLLSFGLLIGKSSIASGKFDT